MGAVVAGQPAGWNGAPAAHLALGRGSWRGGEALLRNLIRLDCGGSCVVRSTTMPVCHLCSCLWHEGSSDCFESKPLTLMRPKLYFRVCE